MLFKPMMLTFPHLKIFTVFSSLPLIIGDYSRNRTTSVGIDHSIVDGELYIKRIVHGEKVSEKPGLLMFTAPYKLCEGGCNGSDGGNIAFGFPLYIGKKGQDAYKNIYDRDFKNLHKSNTNAPFKRSTTKATTTTTTTTTTPTTTTVSTTCSIITIIKYITTQPPPSTAKTTVCPYIPFGMCLKKIKHKNNIITTTPKPTMQTDLSIIENSGDQLEEEDLDKLLDAVTKKNNTNVAQHITVPPATQSIFREANEDFNSNYFYSSELNITSENIGKTNKEQITNNININRILKVMSDTHINGNDTNIKTSDSSSNETEAINEIYIKKMRSENLKNRYTVKDLSELASTMNYALPESSTNEIITTKPFTDTTSNKYSIYNLNNNVEVSVLRNRDLKYRRRWRLDDTYKRVFNYVNDKHYPDRIAYS